jgi:hypothetical protein
MSRHQKLGIIAVHIDPHYSFERKQELLTAISRETLRCKNTLWYVCGDFNFEALGERSYNLKKSTFVESAINERLGQIWNGLMGSFIEHCQPDFTRAQNGPHGVCLSRIDRIYSNLPSWRVLLGANIRTTTCGSVTDTDRLSDHVCVMSSISYHRRLEHAPLAVWVTKDPYYSVALDIEIRNKKVLYLSPVDGVLQLKKCMRQACKQVVNKSMLRGAVTLEEQIFWSLACIRGLCNGYANRVVGALIAYPELERFVLSVSHGRTLLAPNSVGLGAHIAELMHKSIDEARKAHEQASSMPEYQRSQHNNALNRITAMWATRNRKVSLQGARDNAGNVIDDPSEAAASFVSHWKAVAQEKLIDVTAARNFLKQHMRKIPQFRTILTFEAFVEVVRELRDSACGPDGIPFLAWKHASDDAVYV